MAAKKADSTVSEGGDTTAPVKMRVSSKGDGKIHKGSFFTGTHVPELYNKGDTFMAPDQAAADQLIDRGLADVTDE